MELMRLKEIHIVFFLSVNKLMTDKTQNMFYLIAKHSGFIKYLFV